MSDFLLSLKDVSPVSPTACWNGVSGESKGSRRYDKENLLWQFTVAIRSDPVGSQSLYDGAYDNIMDKQNKYDSETEHGTIPDKQDEWNKKYE